MFMMLGYELDISDDELMAMVKDRSGPQWLDT